MNARNRVTRITRALGRRATSRLAATLFLGAIVVAVGVVGYLGLNAATPAGTPGHGQHICLPPDSPVCKSGSGTISGSSPPGIVAAASPR